MPDAPEKRETTRREDGDRRAPRLPWLLVAALALVAAFLFQWKNSLDQASIAQTDSGAIIRVKPENSVDGDAFPRFRFFFSGNAPFSEALLCDGAGNVVCRLKADAGTPDVFRRDGDFLAENFPRERFLRIVVPARQSDGAPVVLLVENPFPQ